MYSLYEYGSVYLSLIDEAYVCEDDSALLTDNDVIVACPSLDDVFSRTSPVSSELPTLSSAITIKLHNNIYEGNYTNGEIQIYIHGHMCTYMYIHVCTYISITISFSALQLLIHFVCSFDPKYTWILVLTQIMNINIS